MNQHEQTAMTTALDAAKVDAQSERAFIAGWEAARKYFPPAVCGVLSPGKTLTCEQSLGHDGDHHGALNSSDGSYIGWPRT